MGASTGIVLSATAISFGNEWVQTSTPNWRIALGGLGTALVFDGIEKINERAAVGLAVIMFITVMFTPFNGNTPSETVITLLGMQEKAVKVSKAKTYGGQYSSAQEAGGETFVR